MITIIIIALLCYIVFTFICCDGIFEFSLSVCACCVFIGFFITFILSGVLIIFDVGHYEIVNSNFYQSITILDDQCNVIFYNYDDSGSYSIEQRSIKLYNCSFIDDGSFVIELRRWRYYDGYDLLFLLPFHESYVIHR